MNYASASSAFPVNAAEFLWSDTVTAYDEAHLFTYAQLLDAEAAGLSREWMISAILGVDVQDAATADLLSRHLARAHWMRQTGYRQLLSRVSNAHEPHACLT